MPRPIALFALLLLAPSLAGAADCVLKDGRVLRDARVIRHDAATVTFRHAHGFTQVDKAKLPEAFAADYPLDEALARREATLQAQAAEARAAESQRRQAEQAQRAAAQPVPAAPPASEPAVPPAYSPSPAPVPGYAWQQSWGHRPHRHYPRRPRFDAPAHATPPTWEIQMTPDVRMTPDLHTYNASPAPTPPPEETEEELPPPYPRPPRRR